MIKSIEYVLNQRTIFKIHLGDGKTTCIKYADIRKFWDFANKSDIEWCTWRICGDKAVFGLTTASGQGGVICAWNNISGEIEHISEGSYVQDCILEGDYLYSLREISNFMMPYHYRVERIHYGIKDSIKEGELLYADKPLKAETCSGLNVIGNTIYVNCNDKWCVFSKDMA